MAMDYRQQIFRLIESITGNKNLLTVPKEFIRLTGDIEVALFLSQLIYWTGKAKDPEGWVFKTYEDWEEEIMLTEYKIRKAKNKLEKLGFLETRIKKANGNPTVHYRLKKDKFSESILKNLKNRSLKNYRNDSLNFTETLTITTTETTAETTTSNNNVELPYKTIIEYLNKKAGIQYKHTANKTRDLIRARFNEGFTLEDFKNVIDKKVKEWKNDLKMSQYLRPHTLFSNKFEIYLNQKPVDDLPPGGEFWKRDATQINKKKECKQDDETCKDPRFNAILDNLMEQHDKKAGIKTDK